MSTILKSLKKLEKEKEGQNPPAPAPALITGLGTHQIMHRSVRTARLKGRIAQWGIFGAGGLVLLILALYALHRPSPPYKENAAAAKPIVQSVSKIKPSPPPMKPVPREDLSTAVQDNQLIAMESKTPPKEMMPPVSAVPPPVAQRFEIGQAPISPPVPPPSLSKDGFEALGQKPAPSTMGVVPVPARRSPPRPIQKQPAQISKPRPTMMPGAVSGESLSAGIVPPGPGGAQPVAAPAETVHPKPEEAAYAGAVRMTNGALKVQAIVYAPTAEERMAVVNNTIVREGSAIDSYTIVGIGAEDVFVREGGGRLLKVPFGKP